MVNGNVCCITISRMSNEEGQYGVGTVPRHSFEMPDVSQPPGEAMTPWLAVVSTGS